MSSSTEGIEVPPQTIHVADLDWQLPDWSEEGSGALVAYSQGYELEVGPSVENPKCWDWLVKPSSAISEVAEIIDSGTAASVSGAQRAAGNVANRHQRERAKQGRQVKDPVTA